MTAIRVAFCNVPRKMGRTNFATAFDRTRAQGDIFGFNETHAGQRKVYRRKARAAGLKSRGIGTPNPVFFDPEIYRGNGPIQIIQLHGRLPALARRFPGYNAARSVTVVPLVHKATGTPVTAALTHLVPNGRKVNARQRASARRSSFRALRRLDRQTTRTGGVFVLMGDMNLHRRFPMTARFRWLKGRGIDKIGYSVKRRKYRAGGRAWTFDAPTDHRGGVAAVVQVHTRIRKRRRWHRTVRRRWMR